jgi:hypothetical protein
MGDTGREEKGWNKDTGRERVKIAYVVVYNFTHLSSLIK